MKKTILYLLLVISVSIYSQTIPAYYNGLDFDKTGDDLFLELSDRIISTHSGIPYTSSSTDVWDACKAADVDPDNAANVLLIYGFDNSDGDATTDRSRSKDLQDTGGTSGTWNREHVFAKSIAIPSFGTDEPGPGTDVHNLRPADTQRNSSRSNRLFTEGSGVESYITSDGGWYPGDEWKGDVARMIMYMYVRYNGDGSQISETKCLPINIGKGTALAIDPNMIDLFLKWNAEDPVSDFEDNRNDVLAGIQKNRNPFIDNPYLATLIWGGLEAEDLWWSNNSSDTESPTEPANLVASNTTDESFEVSWSASTDNVEVYDYSIYINDIYSHSENAITTSTIISNLDSSTKYTVKIKARDAASNYSNYSAALEVTTLAGPNFLFKEDFEDCANFKFNTYSEASSKNWSCSNVYGENNSGSIGINGYQEAVASKDWLITNTSINFDTETGEKISFFTDATYGSTPLVFVYSNDYDGSGNPTEFTWVTVPNIEIPTHSNGGSTEEIYMFNDVDISSITGSVYFAFKYYSDGNPTRWTVDSFEIIADDLNPDRDGDGVLNEDDLCPNTPAGEPVNADGCSNGQLDDDNDGVQNSDDVCADTPAGEDVNATGCSESQLDDDNDGVMNNVDQCPNTPTDEPVNADGCSNGQLDDDNDGVQNSDDVCADTPVGEDVNATGCSESQIDDDLDGVMNNVDQCPNTPTGEPVNADGCSNGQLDDDNDGVQNSDDVCADTPAGEDVNATGCSESQIDDDLDGVMNNVDECSNTPIGEAVNAAGCSESQLDDDNDGVMNNVDQCLATTAGALVNELGCFTVAANNFEIETISETCNGKNNGQIIISAKNTALSYSAVISGNSYTFSDTKTISNLPDGTYDFCVSVDGEAYEQCFAVTIEAGGTIAGKATIKASKAIVAISKGTAPYTVLVNGKEQFETNASNFSIAVNHGDLVEVKTAIDCEGEITKQVDLFETVLAYPNPTNGLTEVSLPVSEKDVTIELYNINGQLISSKVYPVLYGKVQLNIVQYPAGIYIVKVMLPTPIELKIVKE